MAIFNSNKDTLAVANPNALNIINSGTQIIGDVNSDGDMRVDGGIKGLLTSKARLVIGATAVIEGDIKATNIEISGDVTGNIYASELLTIKNTAKISGDVHSNKLIIEAGATFNGNCKMNKTKEASIHNSGNGTRQATNTKSVQPEAIAQ
ncbi:MAG: polymer-forming cytoskeletal protein [Bacteroidia bacterium]|nr:polymer-forming cytoskeletal protein [Bacteroidia bacterium]